MGGVGHREVELGIVEGIVLEPAIKLGRVLVAIGYSDVAELYQAWIDVNRIGTGVGCIGITNLNAEIFGINIAHEINGLEITKQHCMA